MAALDKVEGEMSADGISFAETPNNSRPASRVPVSRMSRPATAKSQRNATSSIGHIALGGPKSRPATAQTRSAQSRPRDPYILSAMEQQKFDQRFEEALGPAKLL